MFKSDFDIEDENYEKEVDKKEEKEEQKGKHKHFKEKKESETINKDEQEPRVEKTKEENLENTNLYNQDYGETGDFSNIGLSKQKDYIDNSSVVFEEKQNETPGEKVKYYFSTINKKIVVLIALIIIICIIVLILISSYISKINASYKAEIITPEIVYMGETGNISVIAQGKKDLENTKTTFTVENSKTVSLLKDNMKGRDIVNTIIPIQEGRSKIKIEANLNGRKMASLEKEVVVCPAFNEDLLLTENISIVKDTSFSLIIDFGEEECAKDIFYESSNDDIMTVDSEGVMTGVKVGKAILTIRKGSRTISANVEITEDQIHMESFKVTPDKLQLTPGENTRLKINYSPANATSVRIAFNSSENNIASISEGGLVTAKSAGTTTLGVEPMTGYLYEEVPVVVSKEVSKEGTVVTDMKLDKTNITMVQGESDKIMATVTPDNVKDKTIKWTSSNPNIASVNNSGVIFAKKAGIVNITASTSNNISRIARVEVIKMKQPVIKATDNIPSDLWHNRAYVLNLSGSENGATYYYGKGINTITNKGDKIIVNKDEKATYYVKACKNNVCSDAVTYNSRLDTTKPKVQTVAGIDRTAVKEDKVQIALQDSTSLIQRWCVTTVNNYSSCKWTTIKTMSNPVVNYTAKRNATYYVFAKDAAGNVSDSYVFEIINIE